MLSTNPEIGHFSDAVVQQRTKKRMCNILCVKNVWKEALGTFNTRLSTSTSFQAKFVCLKTFKIIMPLLYLKFTYMLASNRKAL